MSTTELGKWSTPKQVQIHPKDSATGADRQIKMHLLVRAEEKSSHFRSTQKSGY